jgi:hypothetical protein
MDGQLLSPAKHVEDMSLQEFVTPNSALCMDMCSTLSIHQRLRQGQAANGQRAVTHTCHLEAHHSRTNQALPKHSQLEPADCGKGRRQQQLPHSRWSLPCISVGQLAQGA